MSSINDRNAVLFTTTVSDPNHYCVVGFNEKKEIVKLVEKPEKQFSDTVGIGFYSFPDDTCDLLENVELSIRGEYEITSLNQVFLNQGRLDYVALNRKYVLD